MGKDFKKGDIAIFRCNKDTSIGKEGDYIIIKVDKDQKETESISGFVIESTLQHAPGYYSAYWSKDFVLYKDDTTDMAKDSNIRPLFKKGDYALLMYLESNENTEIGDYFIIEIEEDEKFGISCCATLIRSSVNETPNGSYQIGSTNTYNLKGYRRILRESLDLFIQGERF